MKILFGIGSKIHVRCVKLPQVYVVDYKKGEVKLDYKLIDEILREIGLEHIEDDEGDQK